MKQKLSLAIMVDACGWEIVKNDPFARNFAPVRKRLKSVFGYSSTCVPSILSGRWPDSHRNWCYFVYDPKRSPFKSLRPLQWLPRALTSRRIFRRWLTRLVKTGLKFRGYFDLYNIPFRFISLFDFTEKKSPLKPEGMNCGSNIFDWLKEQKIPYSVSDPARKEEENRDALIDKIHHEEISFGFIYWAGLDGLLHQVGNQSPQVPAKLRNYEIWIEQILQAAKEHYSEVEINIFSDHGMANCDVLLDLKSKIDDLGLQFGEDYAVVYDSTMARFWFFNSEARERISKCLGKVQEGRVLSDEELKAMNTFFDDRYFGELIFLVKEGVLIVPSHMGERPIRAMHGYHPEEKHSFATLFTNSPEIPDDVTAIPDIYRLMTQSAARAHASNSSVPQPVLCEA